MKTTTFLLALLGAMALLHGGAGASEKSGKKLMVIASIPDFADMAREIGGAHVTVESMANGTEDIHAVPVRPSLAAKLARADVLIEMGLENEHAWLAGAGGGKQQSEDSAWASRGYHRFRRDRAQGRAAERCPQGGRAAPGWQSPCQRGAGHGADNGAEYRQGLDCQCA